MAVIVGRGAAAIACRSQAAKGVCTISSHVAAAVVTPVEAPLREPVNGVGTCGFILLEAATISAANQGGHVASAGASPRAASSSTTTSAVDIRI